MSVNDRIILDQVVAQRHSEIAPSLSQSEFFEVFVAEQVLKDFDLSYEEIEAGVVGEGGDGGIDGIYVFANGELVQEDFEFTQLKKNIQLDVVIIQAKRSAGFGESALDKFMSVSEDLFDLSNDMNIYKTVYNDNLIGAVNSFRRVYAGLAARFPTLRFTYVYATRGDDIHPNVKRKVDILKNKVVGLYSSSLFYFAFYGSKELLELARRSPITSYNLSLAETPISSTGDVGFICLVRLRDYYGFIVDESKQLRKSLFEANVRDYQGSTQVNEEIQKSLRIKTREDFWWLNNGVTIVSSKATQSGKILSLEDPQIVNGLQTSTEIYNYFSNAMTDGEDRNLLVRVIVPAEAESRDRIIKATNSQTSIPLASLRATDKIHRDIEEYLKPFGFFYDRRKNSYKNEGKPLDMIVSIALLSQAVMAVLLQRPDTARARPSSLLKSDEDYDKIFSSDYPIDIYKICITILKRSEIFLRKCEALSSKDRNNIRFYVAMHVGALLIGKSPMAYGDLGKIAVESVSSEAIENSFKAVLVLYEKLGASDQAAKGPLLLLELKKDLNERFGIA